MEGGAVAGAGGLADSVDWREEGVVTGIRDQVGRPVP